MDSRFNGESVGIPTCQCTASDAADAYRCETTFCIESTYPSAD